MLLSFEGSQVETNFIEMKRGVTISKESTGKERRNCIVSAWIDSRPHYLHIVRFGELLNFVVLFCLFFFSYL